MNLRAQGPAADSRDKSVPAITTGTATTWRAVGSVVAGVILVLTTLNWIPQLARAQTVHTSSFSADGISQLIASSPNGQIVVRGTDEDTISVTATVTSSLGQTKHSAQRIGDALELNGQCPFNFFNGPCGVDWEVTVPTSMSVQASTRNGRVELVDLDGPVIVKAGNGPILLTGLKAGISASTSNGRIVGSSLESREVNAESKNGPVELDFDVAVRDLNVHTRNGSIRVNVPDLPGLYQVDVTTRNGHEQVGVRTDPTSPNLITLRGENGNVTVQYG